MASLFVFIFIFFPTVAICNNLTKSNSLRFDGLIVSLFYFVIFLVLISLVIPENMAITSNIAISILSISLLSFVWHFKRNVSANNELLPIVTLIFLVVIYGLFSLNVLKFHASPDNHGFAGAVGFFKDNFSYNLLVKKYLFVTGLDSPVFYGQPTPNLPSTWSIADCQLRWTSDMIFTVGRIGLPLLGSLITSLYTPLESFSSFIIFFGVLGSFCVAYLFLEIFKFSYLSLSNKKINTNNLIESLILIITALSNYLIIYVVEGTLNQLWLIVGVQFHILHLIKFSICNEFNHQKASLKILYLSAGPIFISVVYPHGFLLICALSFPILCLIYFNKIKRKNNQSIVIPFVSTMAFLPLTLYLLHGKSLTIPLRMFLNGIAGASYDLGTSTIYQYFIGHPYLLLPTERHGFSLGGLSAVKMHTSIIFLFVTVLVIALVHLIKIKENRSNFFALLGLVGLLLGVVVKSSYAHNFQSYIYARHCANFAAIGLPIMFAITWNAISRSEIFKKVFKGNNFSKIFTVVLFVIFFSTVYDFYKFSNLFNLNSRLFTITANENSYLKLNPKQSIFVSEKPMHEMFSLTLISSLYYLTDDWSPVVKKSYFSNSEINVYNSSLVNNVIHFEKLGTITLGDDLHGPINVDQIRKMPNFMKNR